MTLLSITQQICGEMGIPTISSVVSISNPRSAAFLAIANRSLTRICKQKNWPELWALGSITTVDGTDSYNLATDYDKLLTDTLFDQSRLYQMVGSVDPRRWQWIANYGQFRLGWEYQIRGNPKKIYITPTPDDAITASYFYKSLNYALSSGSVAKPLFTADDDTCAIDEELIALDMKWRYLKSRGFDYAEEFREAKEAVEQRFAESMAAPSIPIGNANYDWVTDGYVPDRGYGS